MLTSDWIFSKRARLQLPGLQREGREQDYQQWLDKRLASWLPVLLDSGLRQSKTVQSCFKGTGKTQVFSGKRLDF
jgi:hypothetical protein